ncbi:hypothetical protein [Paenibacillus sp. IHBB 3054]|uniref:hypothetical protein n=1 Tax=Paenibacillus sp. IHBB 3054 TaxID=3425689 RepID=UPI003F679A38
MQPTIPGEEDDRKKMIEKAVEAVKAGDKHSYEIIIHQFEFGYFNSKPETSYHVNELYAPFAATPKTVTIKPFTLTVKNDDSSVCIVRKGNHAEMAWFSLVRKVTIVRLQIVESMLQSLCKRILQLYIHMEGIVR